VERGGNWVPACAGTTAFWQQLWKHKQKKAGIRAGLNYSHRRKIAGQIGTSGRLAGAFAAAAAIFLSHHAFE
jgi:hypothetical protein